MANRKNIKREIKERRSSKQRKSGSVWFMPVLGLIIVITLVVLFIIMSQSLNALPDLIRKSLDDVSDGQITCGTIKVNPTGSVSIRDLNLWTKAEEVEPIWNGRELNVRVRLSSLLRGKIVPKTVTLDGFVFRFKQKSNGDFTLPLLNFVPSNAQGGSFVLKTFGFEILNSQVIYEEHEVARPNPIKLKVDNINATGTYYENRRIALSRFNGEYEGARLRVKGEFAIDEPYKADLKIDIDDLNLSYFAGSLARLFPSNQALLPSGGGGFNVNLSRSLLDPEIKGKCRLDTITIGNFHIEDALFDINYLNKSLTLSNGVAKAYNGRINLSGMINAGALIPDFTLEADVKGIDIGEYLDSLKKGGIEPIVSGSFDGSFRGGGTFTSGDSFYGEGDLTCDGGLYLNPFKDVKLGMFSARQDEFMEFVHLYIVYKIESSKFLFNKVDMKSKWVDLSANGEFSFNGAADIEGVVSASTELIKPASGFKEIAQFITEKVNRIPVRFLMTGSPPEYEFYTALPKEVIESMLGDDEMLRQDAYELLRKYFSDADTGY